MVHKHYMSNLSSLDSVSSNGTGFALFSSLILARVCAFSLVYLYLLTQGLFYPLYVFILRSITRWFMYNHTF